MSTEIIIVNASAMSLGQLATEQRSKFTWQSNDWETKAVFAGTDYYIVNWVGQGTCDAGDGLGARPSIIYLVQGVPTSNTYDCTACIGDGFGSYASFNVVHTDVTCDEEVTIFTQLTTVGGNQELGIWTTSGDVCPSSAGHIRFSSSTGSVEFMGYKLDDLGDSD